MGSLERIDLNFYGERVCIQSDWSEVLCLLKKDFSAFVVPDDHKKSAKVLTVSIFKEEPRTVQIPSMVSKMQSLNAISYQEGSTRYSDFYGKLLSIFDYKSEVASLYSLDMEKLHEISYLLVLSRVGKRLDLKSLHKLHAFAISYNNLVFVCMMPMKGGKSTLLLELLKNDKVKMISDDIPLVDIRGRVFAFPLKIGVNVLDGSFPIFEPAENIYHLNRELYGPKTFICLNGLQDKFERPGVFFNKVIVAEAFRFNSTQTLIASASFLKTFKGLFKHGVIGIGTPIVVEYFWEFGFRDLITKSIIFLRRFYAFFVLGLKSKKLSIFLGKDPVTAAKEIIDYLERSDSSGN